jgi:peptidoglycan/LPS O-acetylase OafA/YrhL
MSVSSLNPSLHGKRRLPALTSLRIFAAMHVVLFHCALFNVHESARQWIASTAGASAPLHWTAVILGRGVTNILAAGSWAVSLFFILSGFILFYNYGDNRQGPLDSRKFWIARFARIYPVYLLGLLMMAPFMIHRTAEGVIPIPKLAVGGAAALTMLQAWNRHYAAFWNAPGWSMSVEAFCYALFPLLMIPLRRVVRPAALFAVIAVCWFLAMAKGPIIWVCIRQWWIAGGGANDPNSIGAITDYTPLCRLPEFIAGMALGRLMLLRGGPRIRGAALTLSTLAVIAASLLLAALGPHCPWFLAVSGGITPLFAILIWNLTVDESLLTRLLAWSPLVFLGEASYAVYILHLPLRHFSDSAINRLAPASLTQTMFDIPSYWVLILYIAMVLGVCSLVYRWFELPARDYIRTRLTRRRAAPSAGSGLAPLEPATKISQPVSP